MGKLCIFYMTSCHKILVFGGSLILEAIWPKLNSRLSFSVSWMLLKVGLEIQWLDVHLALSWTASAFSAFLADLATLGRRWPQIQVSLCVLWWPPFSGPGSLVWPWLFLLRHQWDFVYIFWQLKIPLIPVAFGLFFLVVNKFLLFSVLNWME